MNAPSRGQRQKHSGSFKKNFLSINSSSDDRMCLVMLLLLLGLPAVTTQYTDYWDYDYDYAYWRGTPEPTKNVTSSPTTEPSRYWTPESRDYLTSSRTTLTKTPTRRPTRYPTIEQTRHPTSEPTREQANEGTTWGKWLTNRAPSEPATWVTSQLIHT